VYISTITKKILDTVISYLQYIISSALIAIFCWFFNKTETVPSTLCLIYLAFTLPITIGSLAIIRKNLCSLGSNSRPKLKIIYSQQECLTPIYIFEYSINFSSDTVVSLYYCSEQGIEINLGIGFIETITDTKQMIQLRLLKLKEGYSEDFLYKEKKNIFLKNSIPYYEIKPWFK
jgi:hypothetical protein